MTAGQVCGLSKAEVLPREAARAEARIGAPGRRVAIVLVGRRERRETADDAFQRPGRVYDGEARHS